MIQLYFLTIHPRIISSYSEVGVVRAAVEQGIASCVAVDLRAFSVDKHGSVDDHPYGGGDGMVMRPEPIRDAIKSIGGNPVVINASPRGKKWTHADAVRFRDLDRPIIFICGRFGGVDQRVIDRYVDEEYSLGDVIVSGGELPNLMIADSILRLVPGVLGNSESAEIDSFSAALGLRLEHDLYTRPQDFEGVQVPSVLLSGNHEQIKSWRLKNSLEVTQRLRPDLLNASRS
jgi:tRNA (guanine37-N1)-methyltransferase